MFSRARLRSMADYFAATRNEVAVDEMFIALSKMNTAKVGYFPRVPTWIGLASHRPYLTRTLSRIARAAWLAGGWGLFFIWEYLKFYRLHRSIGTLTPTETDGAILGLSTRVCDIVTPTKFPAFPQTWLTLPWAPQLCLPKGARELPMLSILEGSDLLSALVDALTVTHRMKRDRSLSPWVMQTYTAYRWFLVRRAVDRLSGTLVMTEHYDRWAVLVDRAVRERRRAQGCIDYLVVVQHGAMGALNEDENFGESLLNLPTRLRQVDELHAYNSDEAAAFRANVFGLGKVSRALEVCFFKPTIELMGEVISNRPRILFVGHPLCESFHIQVFRKLTTWKIFEIYYKPHPKGPMSASAEAVNWKIIKEEKIFPRVDLLISYPSTLVIEYENVGIPASVHPLDVGIDELTKFLEKTRALVLEKCAEYFAGNNFSHMSPPRLID